MSSERHLNDLLARRALSHQPSPQEHDDTEGYCNVENDEDSYEEEIAIDDNRTVPQPTQKQPTLMDMLMNGNRTTTITVGGSSNVSPAVLDYMRVTNTQPNQQGKKGGGGGGGGDTATTNQADNVALDERYETLYAERMVRIRNKIELRDRDEFDDEDEDELSSIDFNHSNDDEDDAMMRDLMGGVNGNNNNGGGGHPPHRKKQRKVVSSKDSCFLCAFGDRFHDGIRAPHIARLNDIYEKFYGKMSNYELANAMHLYFKANIYSEDDSIPMLESHVVLEHIEGRHSLAALNFIVESIKDYEQVKFIAKGCLCKADGTINHRVFAIFDKAQTKLEKLYTMKIDNMNFNNGQTIEDLNSKGSYFNLMPMFSQREERTRRLKRKASPIQSATNTFDL